MGHRPPVKGGYFPVPPVDSLQDIRSAMCLALEEQGVEVEVHHHEVAAPGQCEIGTKFNSLVKRADWMQILKYTVHNVAHSYGKTATFMPKPVVGDNGSGMHVHQSIWKGGQNLFSRQRLRRPVRVRAVLHRRHHQARQGAERDHQPRHQLVQAPGARLRSADQPRVLGAQPLGVDAAFRYVSSPKARRIEVRFPDPTANPYLAFTAMMMAGLDGMQNKIHPGDPIDKNLYDLPPEEAKKVPNVCSVARHGAGAPRQGPRVPDRAAACSPNDMLDAYIALKMEEVTRFRMTTHPVEFEMYYSL